LFDRFGLVVGHVGESDTKRNAILSPALAFVFRGLAKMTEKWRGEGKELTGKHEVSAITN